MSTKIGKANYGGQYVKKNYYKLKDGESVFRILPPLGDLAESGRWSVFYNVHYGYKNSKGQLRTFQSPEVKNRQSKMIEQPDAAKERIAMLKAELEKAKAANNGPLIEKLGKLVGNGAKVMGQYNLDNNHYVNVVDQQGNIGILKLRHRAKLALDATIKRLRETGIDPLSAEEGRFFVFRRSGMGLDTSFQVDVLKEKLTVQGVGVVERDVVHKLDDAIIARLSKEAAQLDKLYKRPTSEQVARIVKEGASAVDEILDAKSGSSESTDEGFEDEGDYQEPTVTQAAAPVVTPQAAAPAATVVSQPVEAAQATTTFTAPKAESLSTPTKTSAQAISEQTDEDFLKSLGL